MQGALVVLVLVSGLRVGLGHESCCAHDHHHHHSGDDHAHGHAHGPAMVPDWSVDRPAGWDEAEDGPWERPMIPAAPPGLAEQIGGQLAEAAPWVLAGLLLTGLMAALPLDRLAQRLSGGRGCLEAAGLGLASPLCSCGALPVASALVSQGVGLGPVVSFLTAAQSAGLDSAVITWGLLGPTACIARLAGATALATFTGLAVRSSGRAQAGAESTPRVPDKRWIGIRLAGSLIDSAGQILPSVGIGIAASVLLQRAAPSVLGLHEALSQPGSLAWLMPALGRIVVIGSALPLQLCEHSTVAIAAGIQKAGGSAGLAFGFLLSAPATNLPTLLLLFQQGGVNTHWTVVRVVAAMVLSRLGLSYIVDAAGMDLLVQQEATAGAASLGLPPLFVQYSPHMIGVLAVAAVCKIVWLKVNQAKCCGESKDKMC